LAPIDGVLVHIGDDMRSMPDCAFDDMTGVDVLRDFDYLSSHFDVLETSDVANEADRDSVWLECNSELVDAASVKLLAVHKSACGFEALLFICPRCREPHESVRFR
jgi:hypothetical protein